MCIFQTVFSIIRTYINTLKKDRSFQTWQCRCAEEDISRIAFNVLGIKPSPLTELEEVRRSVNDIEEWLPKSHVFIIMFERVWHELFQISSVSTYRIFYFCFLFIIFQHMQKSTQKIYPLK